MTGEPSGMPSALREVHRQGVPGRAFHQMIAYTELRSRKYQVIFFKSAGSCAPHTPSPLRGYLRVALRRRPRASARAPGGAWRLGGKLSPAQFGVIRRSLNATWYKTAKRKSHRTLQD